MIQNLMMEEKTENCDTSALLRCAASAHLYRTSYENDESHLEVSIESSFTFLLINE